MWGFIGYALRRLLMISLTILVGVYITVLIANKGGQINDRVRAGADKVINAMRFDGWLKGIPLEEHDAMVNAKRRELLEAEGYYLPDGLRNLYWTWKALRFDWGVSLMTDKGKIARVDANVVDIRAILKKHLPNTLLLVGTANLLIFFVGIPLALYIASLKTTHWLNRAFTTLSPLSSVPSWIYGIFLVAIFAAGLKILPAGDKYDIMPPLTQLERITQVTRHMILPVTAIILGVIFQLINIWRTYFTIHAEEDYVDLAIAKGLEPRAVERRYILRPTMPYILTSFALTLVGFWQVTTALEYFFYWPGIGLLYVNALPNYLGMSFDPGEMSIVISIVVLFAYLLGLIVFILDLAYAWLDPRIRLNNNHQTMQAAKRKKIFRVKGISRDESLSFPSDMDFGSTLFDPPAWLLMYKQSVERFRSWLGERGTNKQNFAGIQKDINLHGQTQFWWDNFTASVMQGTKNLRTNFSPIWREIRKSPAAITGLTIIIVMIGGSLYAAIAFPFREIGREFYTESVTGKISAPRNALPQWTNWLRTEKLPETLKLSSQDETIEKIVKQNMDGTKNIAFLANFVHPYRSFPQDILLYFDPTYKQKRPFLSSVWKTPDKREFTLRNASVESGKPFYLSDLVKLRIELRKNPGIEEWFVIEEPGMMPGFYLLMADPNSKEPAALPGTHTLEITAMTFEEDSDLEVEIVVLGQVSGIAGTDASRRDLIVPLLWGMPFALAIGISGAFFTTFAALVLSAAGTWKGGWLDNLIQRMTEVNMILPILAIGILVFALYNVKLFIILGAIIFLGVFGSPTKTFRSAFLQIKEEPYFESARAYGSSNSRIVFRYMIPRIFPLVIPQLVILIPSFVFLEATLAIFNVFDPYYPTWGKTIQQALSRGALWGGTNYWVLEPITLLLLAGLGFALLGSALERILTPRLLEH